MASIFTFEPEPLRVSSPWLKPDADTAVGGTTPTPQPLAVSGPDAARTAGGGITRLAAEPQAGPTEYKLHLLLRPRRKYTSSTTGTYIAGSQHSSGLASQRSSSPRQLEGTGSILAPSHQTRQTRLQQLTTQLLWRLQQSLPHHSSSATNGVSPSSVRPDPRLQRGGMLPGLEESHGALYEIGVSDEGTCVGLTQDELDESLETLRVMARSLGCAVQVLRLVLVGSCEWTEESQDDPKQPERSCKGDLWAAEALVKPAPHGGNQCTEAESGETSTAQPDQLRVSLTGSTNSGKSSLLGTLSSSVLDNSRGRSRLCLLRHRHELESGLTSSVAHELVGYRRPSTPSKASAEVVNYASGNVSSWTDIHVSSQCTRLVFFSDSAGHPRYRRTAIRGLVGWAPHWAALCVAADGETDPPLEPNPLASTKDGSGTSGTSIGLSSAHLKLSLDLEMPLMVIVTKLDVASKPGLKSILGTVLSTLKAAGRKPIIMPTREGSGKQISPEELQTISDTHEADAEHAIEMVHQYGLKVAVPVVLTSAVQGAGIASIHALLSKLPIPIPVARSTSRESDALVSNRIPSALFHIEDVFALPSSFAAQSPSNTLHPYEHGSVISGHLSRGDLSIGDELLLGPFPVDEATEELTIGDDGERHHSGDAGDEGRDRVCGPSPPAVTALSEGWSTWSRILLEWRKMRIISIRNLRLPTSKLLSGQVGSIGVVQPPTGSDHAPQSDRPSTSPSSPPVATSILSVRIRKGMVLARFPCSPPRSSGGFVGVFDHLSPSTLNEACPVIVYFASVRAAARISRVRVVNHQAHEPDRVNCNEQVLGSGSVDCRPANDGLVTQTGAERTIEMSFCFLSCREWIETGGQVLVMPSGAGISSGVSESGGEGAGLLEGFVGRIVQATP